MNRPSKVGAPWPRGQYGEVVGPSGQRCHTPESAAAILGVTDRWVRDLVRDDAHEVLRLDAFTGMKRQYFVTAESVEAFARQQGRWPPADVVVPKTLGSDEAVELFVRQGRDLEKARSALKSALSDNEKLSQDNKRLRGEVRRLRRHLSHLTAAAAQLSASLDLQWGRQVSDDDDDEFDSVLEE